MTVSTRPSTATAWAVPRWLLSPEVGLVVTIALFVAFFGWQAEGFLGPFNTFALARDLAVAVLMGYAMMVVLAIGGMNLAVGSIGVCVAMVMASLQAIGWPLPVTIVAGLLAGAALGALNGIVVVRAGLSSFVVTLATMSVYFGVMLLVTRADSIRNLDQGFIEFGRARAFGPVPVMLLVAIGIGVLLAYFYRATDLGRQMLFTGSNPKASELSGVPVVRAVVLAHALSGLLAGAAAIVLTARTGAAIPSMAGQIGRDWLLPAFVAPVLGGTSLSGGSISIFGTLLGALLVAVLASGLRLLQVGDFWIELFLGVILLIAVLADRLRLLWRA